MAAQSFLAMVSGKITRVFAILVSAGSGDANKIPALDANGKLDISFMPSGVGANNISVVSSENLAAGDIVNVYNNAGTLNVRKADNTSAGKEISGFVTAAVTSPAAATVWLPDGMITGLSSLTPGAYYWLGTTGALTATAPSTAGNISQVAGYALSASVLMFAPQEPVTM